MMTSSRRAKRNWKALKRGLGATNWTVSERGGLGGSSPSYYQQQQYIPQLSDSNLTSGVVGVAFFRCCLIGKQEQHSTTSNNLTTTVDKTVSIELVTVAGSHCVYFPSIPTTILHASRVSFTLKYLTNKYSPAFDRKPSSGGSVSSDSPSPTTLRVTRFFHSKVSNK